MSLYRRYKNKTQKLMAFALLIIPYIETNKRGAEAPLLLNWG
jgi:hypothetical protein